MAPTLSIVCGRSNDGHAPSPRDNGIAPDLLFFNGLAQQGAQIECSKLGLYISGQKRLDTECVPPS
jgi:hypothetical protein